MAPRAQGKTPQNSIEGSTMTEFNVLSFVIDVLFRRRVKQPTYFDELA